MERDHETLSDRTTHTGSRQFEPCAAQSASCDLKDAIAKLSGGVQWVHSHIAANNTFCIYFADSEDWVREHSRLAGFPITRVNEVASVIDPTTAAS